MNIIKRIKCEITYRMAVNSAERLHTINGKDYFVMPLHHGRLIVLSRAEYTWHRREGNAPKEIKPRDLYRECVYHTHCLGKKGKVVRKNRWLRWLDGVAASLT